MHGDPAFHQYRPDTPRERDGKAVKYAMPVKVRMVLDAPLPTQHKLDDVSAPLWVTEAPIKADAIVSAGGTAVATFGVWGFKGRRPRGGASTMLPDWEWIALQGRTVYLVPDSDVASNKHVRDAVTRLGLALDSRGADVRYCYVPGTADGAKRGVDDYLAGGGTLDGLMETADDTPPSGSQAPGGNVAATLFRGADDRFTDARMAETVAHELLAGRFIWVAALGWLTWDGRRWADCSDVTVGEAVRAWTLERFKDAVTDLQAGKGDQAALDGWRNMLQATKEAAVIKLARGIVEHQADQLDADPDLINTPDGVVDPRTLETLAHDPALLMTRITSGSYRPGFKHPDWERAQEALPAEERAWIRTRVGQAMTGHRTPDGRLVVLQGSGENGKGVMFTDGAVPALGDYAGMTSAKLFKAGEHSEEMATLHGKRLLVAEELAEGRSIDVAAMKRVQDVGRITARESNQARSLKMARSKLLSPLKTARLNLASSEKVASWNRASVSTGLRSSSCGAAASISFSSSSVMGTPRASSWPPCLSPSSAASRSEPSACAQHLPPVGRRTPMQPSAHVSQSTLWYAMRSSLAVTGLVASCAMSCRVGGKGRPGGRHLVVEEAQRPELPVIAEDPLAAAHHQRVKHYPELIDQVVLDEDLHQQRFPPLPHGRPRQAAASGGRPRPALLPASRLRPVNSSRGRGHPPRRAGHKCEPHLSQPRRRGPGARR